MIDRFRRWRRRMPSFQNPIQDQQAPMFQDILLGMATTGAVLITIFLSVNYSSFADRTLMIAFISLLSSFLTGLTSLIILRRGHFSAAATIIIVFSTLSVLLGFLQSGLSTHWTSFFSLSLPIVLSGFLGSRRMVWWIIGILALSLTLIGWLSQPQIALLGTAAPMPISPSIGIISFTVVAGVLGLCFHGFSQVVQRSMLLALERQLQLEEVQSQQEQIIATRTHDLQLALTAVEQREHDMAQTLAELQTSQQTIQALSAPIIPVLPGVLMVALVGSLDSKRAEIATTNTLQAVEQQATHAVIFDVTGVDIVDTQVAQVLIHTATAVQLLGAQAILVGIRPEVAQTLTALAIDLNMFRPFGNLQDAVTALLIQDGWRNIRAIPNAP